MGPEVFGQLNIQAMLRNLLNNGVCFFINSGAPTSGVTFAGKAGIGSVVINISTGNWYLNTGTLASPAWIIIGSSGEAPLIATRQLTNAEILALPTTSIEIIPAPGVGKYLVPLMCIADLDKSNGDYGATDTTLNQGASDIVVTWGNNAVNVFRAIPMDSLTGVHGDKQSIFCYPFMGLSVPTVAADQLWAFPMDYPFNGADHSENNHWTISADNGVGAFTGGGAGNTLTFKIWYFIRTYGALI